MVEWTWEPWCSLPVTDHSRPVWLSRSALTRLPLTKPAALYGPKSREASPKIAFNRCRRRPTFGILFN